MTKLRRTKLVVTCAAAGLLFGFAGCQHHSRQAIPSPVSPSPTAADTPFQWQPPTIADPRSASESCRLLLATCHARNLLLTPAGQPPAVIERLETWNAPGALPILYIQGISCRSGSRYGCFWLLLFNAAGDCCEGVEFNWPLVAHRTQPHQLAVTECDYAGRKFESVIPVRTDAELNQSLEADHFTVGEVFTPLDRPTQDYAQFEAVFGRIEAGDDRGAMELHRRLAAYTAADRSYELVDLARGWNTACSRHWTRRLVLFDTANRPVAQWIVDQQIDPDRIVATATGIRIPSENPAQADAHLDCNEAGEWLLRDSAGLLVQCQ